jgi:hypothetical protein
VLFQSLCICLVISAARALSLAHPFPCRGLLLLGVCGLQRWIKQRNQSYYSLF